MFHLYGNCPEGVNVRYRKRLSPIPYPIRRAGCTFFSVGVGVCSVRSSVNDFYRVKAHTIRTKYSTYLFARQFHVVSMKYCWEAGVEECVGTLTTGLEVPIGRAKYLERVSSIAYKPRRTILLTSDFG